MMSATTREAIISERLGEFGFGQRGRNLPLSSRVSFGCPGRTPATLVAAARCPTVGFLYCSKAGLNLNGPDAVSSPNDRDCTCSAGNS